MRLSCPSCKTTFEIPSEKATAGKKVRCARCKVVFRIPGAADPTPSRGSQAVASPPADEITGSQRTAFEDLQAAEAAGLDAPGSAEPAWGEPELGDPSDLDSEPRLDGPVADGFGGARSGPSLDPFEGVDLSDESAAEPLEIAAESPQVVDAQPVTGPSVGMSAIRAQSGATADGGLDEDVSGAWMLRLSDGAVRNFDSMEEVHTYLGANPDAEAEVSSDGRSWQDPASLRSMQAPRPPVREPTGLSVALRAAAAPTTAAQGPASTGWKLVAGLSTLTMLAAVVVALQTYQLIEVSPWVPFESVGLSAISDLRGDGSEDGLDIEDPAVDPQTSYEAFMGTATRARKNGQLVDAAIAYRRAVDTVESPEALEALAEVYETLGESRLARQVRKRLEALREKRGKRTP